MNEGGGKGRSLYKGHTQLMSDESFVSEWQ